MTTDPAKPFTHIDLIPAAPDQQPILANLLELYIYDFSDILDLHLGPDGRFGYPRLPLYWTEPGRHPFLVKVDGRLAGFVLIKRGSEVSGDEAVWDIAEFFVLRGCRRLGIGTQLAHMVWRRFPGTWEVRVMEANIPACRFWVHAISTFTDKPATSLRFEKDGNPWALFSFKSSGIA